MWKPSLAPEDGVIARRVCIRRILVCLVVVVMVVAVVVVDLVVGVAMVVAVVAVAVVAVEIVAVMVYVGGVMFVLLSAIHSCCSYIPDICWVVIVKYYYIFTKRQLCS